MKILHIDFSGPFTDNAGYQENLFPIANKLGGHEVVMLVTNLSWSGNNIQYLTNEEHYDYFLGNGIRIIRFQYVNIGGKFISGKIRKVKGLYAILTDLKPEVIFLHCPQTHAVLQICKYIKKNGNVKFYVDNHADKYNSASNVISKFVLHKCYYKFLIKRMESYAEFFYATSFECGEFLKHVYHVPEKKIDYLLSGGFLVPQHVREHNRSLIRNKYNIKDTETIFVHAGKMDSLKETVQIVRLFFETKDRNAKLFLVGSMNEWVKKNTKKYIVQDDRIIFVGWKTFEELEKYLCAGDVLLQPGSVSAIAEHAMCCSMAMVLRNCEGYKMIFDNNGWLVENADALKVIFSEIKEGKVDLQKMGNRSYAIAERNLDYTVQSRRLFGDVE